MPDWLHRARRGAIASLVLLTAGISLLAMTRLDAIEFAPQRNLYVIAAVMVLVSALGPLHDVLDVPGRILFWNGIGWCTGLAIFGLESVGSLPVWPIILAALALTFWPRNEHGTLPIGAVAIAFLGGIGICWLLWGDIYLAIPPEWKEWIDG